MTISNGGEVSSDSGNIGNGTPGTGTVTVDGTGSTWTNTGDLIVGNNGTGELTIQNGGVVSNTDGLIGNNSGSTGKVTVDGAGSSWTYGGSLIVGNSGDGELVISNGGHVSYSSSTQFATTIGNAAGSTGKVTVDGAGSGLTHNSTFIVGFSGNGELSIRNGALVSNVTGLIGLSSGSTGKVTVDGAGSTWTNTGSLTVGNAGNATLTVSNGGTVEASGVQAGSGNGIATINIGAAQGETAVAAGVLDTPTVSLGNRGALVFNHTDTDYAFVTKITGTGAVRQLSGTTVLNGANAYSGATTVSGGTLQAGVANAFSAGSAVTVESQGTLDANGLSQTVASLGNAGIVNIGKSGVDGNILKVTGNYTGNGGTVRLNTVLGGDDAVTDKLHVGGDVTGTSVLKITNAGGAGEQTVNGIQVVQVDGTSDAKSPDGKSPVGGANFRLGNTVKSGAYEYILQSKGEDWYLVSFVNDVTIYSPEVSNYVSGQRINQETGMLQLSGLHQRVGEHRTLPLEKQSWAKVYYNHLSEDGSSRFGYDMNLYGLQIGQEVLARQTGDGGTVRAAVSLDYSRADANMNDRMRQLEEGLNRETGNLRSDSWALGGYVTKTWQNGAYVDVVGQLGWLENRYDAENWDGTRDSTKQTGWRVGLSAEGGYPLWKQDKWLLEGQGQLSYQYTDYRSNEIVDSYGADMLRGRLGLRLVHTEKLKDNRTLEVYGLANIVHDFLNEDAVSIKDRNGRIVNVSESYGSTWGEIGLGIQGWVSKSTSVFGDIRYQRGFTSPSNGDAREGGALNIGVRYTF